MSMNKAERSLYESNVMKALGVSKNSHEDAPVLRDVDETVGNRRCTGCHEDVPGDVKRCPYCNLRLI